MIIHEDIRKQELDGAFRMGIIVAEEVIMKFIKQPDLQQQILEALDKAAADKMGEGFSPKWIDWGFA